MTSVFPFHDAEPTEENLWIEIKLNLIKFRGTTVETINTHTGPGEEEKLEVESEAEYAIQKKPD